MAVRAGLEAVIAPAIMELSSRMHKVFPCYATADRELVREQLAAFPGARQPAIEVLFEEGEIQNDQWRHSLIAKGLKKELLPQTSFWCCFSPRSPVPAALGSGALEIGLLGTSRPPRSGTHAGPTLPVSRLQGSPDLLRRKNFFDLRQNRLAAFRAIKRWLMSLSPLPRSAPFAPARQPSFNGRDAELETLCTLLADAPGMAVLEAAAGAGKTTLATEFARRHQEEFDAVFWLTCGVNRAAPALAGDPGRAVGRAARSRSWNPIWNELIRRRLLRALRHLSDSG